jgi:hypothetical protein
VYSASLLCIFQENDYLRRKDERLQDDDPQNTKILYWHVPLVFWITTFACWEPTKLPEKYTAPFFRVEPLPGAII